jgi:hypothetical protein
MNIIPSLKPKDMLDAFEYCQDHFDNNHKESIESIGKLKRIYMPYAPHSVPWLHFYHRQSGSSDKRCKQAYAIEIHGYCFNQIKLFFELTNFVDKNYLNNNNTITIKNKVIDFPNFTPHLTINKEFQRSGYGIAFYILLLNRGISLTATYHSLEAYYLWEKVAKVTSAKIYHYNKIIKRIVSAPSKDTVKILTLKKLK